ncbi:MAG: hypothetical protein IT249_07840 [Chitinophagaceae bacterium]|nr:hypothetical protein [Chitinophagaceae bacterium]
MKTYIKNIFIIAAAASIWSCTKQPYYEVPTDGDGNVTITGVAKTTSAGITTLDDAFTVTSILPNAKAGDVMKVELLQLQTPPGGGALQLLPMAGTQKEVTLGSDLTAVVNYTRAEAKLNNTGDYVTVTFSGKTDAATYRVNLKDATTVTNPQYNGKDVDVIRTAGIASFKVTVTPASGTYAGNVVVKKKNGTNEAWQSVGTFAPTDLINVSGDDFAVGKDTMIYSFITTQGTYTNEVIKTVVASNPYFFLKKTGTLSTSTDGFNLLNGSAVASTNANAVITLGANLTIAQGSAWATGGKGISFVPSTVATYNLNNVTTAKNEFAAGTAVTSIDPSMGTGIYVFKLVNGATASDILYGMLKVTKLTPGTSAEFEYRIGNLYAHNSVIQ